MKYGLDDKPGLAPLLLYGLQWWVVLLPSVIIMGIVVARLHYDSPDLQIFYIRKLFILMGIASVIQVLWGHKLPLIMGPASTLLVGIVASTASGVGAIYTSIFIGGAVLVALAYSGLLSRLRFFFTPRIVAVILVLIAFSLSPTILRLILANTRSSAFCIGFATVMAFALVLFNKWLPGMWKSMTVIIGIVCGSLVYFLFSGLPALPVLSGTTPSLSQTFIHFEFHPGTILSFLFCFLALTINELGSIESLGHMLKAEGMNLRIRKGTGLQGITNMAAGGLGVIGPVDYSMSAGVIAATGCASRYTLIPAGIGLAFCALFPKVVLMLSCIPGPVMGALLLYLMASQMSSGLTMLVTEKGITNFNSGITVSLPLMLGLLISFAPGTAFDGFPELVRPLVSNGFVMGTIAVIILEHAVFRNNASTSPHT